MPPARRTYASPSYASPPLPVFVTEADLPRVIAVVVFGTLAASWLALQLDAYFAADGRHDDFYFPYERTVALEALSMAMACYLCVTIDSSMPVMCMCVCLGVGMAVLQEGGVLFDRVQGAHGHFALP